MKRTVSAVVVMFFLVTLCACAGQTRQQRGTGTGVAVGAGLGAALGQAIGKDTEATLLGAGIGAVLGGIAGNQIGAYMDRQEQALRDAMAASDAVSIQRTQDVLTATFKSDVFFDFDSATLKPGAYGEIDRISNVLNSYPQTTIRVEGHTDATGSETYNQQLSERRAESVKNAIVQRGIDPRRMQAIGYGESQPISSDNAMNRRVSVVITPVRQG
ncbi:MAG: OmpA family protein [Thermodesulfobacteriota bacterium]|nr:OmpA family protein [Thermodesulfobacteriota bacterium]